MEDSSDNSTEIYTGTTSLLLILLRGKLAHNPEVFERRDIAGDGVGGHNLAQEPPHDFAGAGFGEAFGEADLFGASEGADFVRHPLAEFDA